MLNEDIKKVIIKELTSEMPNINVSFCLDILERVLDFNCDRKELQGIKERYTNAIEKIFDSQSSYKDILEGISTFFKVEPLFRLILFISNKPMYDSLANERKGFYNIIKNLGLNPNNYDLDKNISSYLNTSKYMEQISQTYKIRNLEAHHCNDWGRKELFYNIFCVMEALLYCIHLKKDDLISHLSEICIEMKWYTKSRHQPIFVDITIIKEQHRNHNSNYIHNKLFMEVLHEIH